MKPKILFAVAAALIVIGVVLMAVPTPGEPKLQCVSQSAPSSGFTDADQDDCPVSVESYEEYAEWSSGPRWDNVAGLVLVVAGLGTAVVAGVKARRRPTA
jgi:hypothetical protein